MKWPWTKPEPPAPKSDRFVAVTPLEKAAQAIFDREFQADAPVIFQTMAGLLDNRIRIIKPDGTWLAELVDCVDGICRVRLEPFDG